MSIAAVIKNRRTTYQFSNAKVPQDILNQCLEAAIWAPNHKMRQPWLFWQLGEVSQAWLSQIYAEHRASKKVSQQDPEWTCLYDKAVQKFQRIPQVILVGQKLVEHPVDVMEDYAACACAIQNFQLMATELQLGVQWSTGPIICDERVYQFLNLDKTQTKLIAALYMGFPEGDVTSVRKSYEASLIKLN